MDFFSLRSSQDPTQLSLTIKGLLSTLAPIILMLLNKFGVVIGNEEFDSIVTVILAVITGIITLYGLIRRILNQSKNS